MQIKTQGYLARHSRMSILSKEKGNKFWKEYGQKEHLCKVCIKIITVIAENSMEISQNIKSGIRISFMNSNSAYLSKENKIRISKPSVSLCSLQYYL
jgi:hypothetical protein